MLLSGNCNYSVISTSLGDDICCLKTEKVNVILLTLREDPGRRRQRVESLAEAATSTTIGQLIKVNVHYVRTYLENLHQLFWEIQKPPQASVKTIF